MTRFLLSLTFLFFFCAVSRAEEPDFRPLFVVETDEESASESLERISGEYDLGFASPSQTYDSPSHYTPGPTGRQKAVEQANQR